MRSGVSRRLHRHLPGGPGLHGIHFHPAVIARPEGTRSPEGHSRNGEGEVRRLLYHFAGRMGLRLRFGCGKAVQPASGEEPEGFRRRTFPACNMLGRRAARISGTDAALGSQEHLLHLQNRRGEIRVDGPVHGTQPGNLPERVRQGRGIARGHHRPLLLADGLAPAAPVALDAHHGHKGA